MIQKPSRADTKRQHKYSRKREASNIGCILSLDPLEQLTADEFVDFFTWQRSYTGHTADEFAALPREERLCVFLEWCAELARHVAYIGVRIFSRGTLEIENN